MPDYLHLILRGSSPIADTWRAMVNFKQRSGYWLSQNRSQFRWQRGFFDHIIRKSEDLVSQIRYVAENPIRKNLVQNCYDFPYTGSFGIDLKSVINGFVGI